MILTGMFYSKVYLLGLFSHLFRKLSQMKKLLLSLMLLSSGVFAADYNLHDLSINAPWVHMSDGSTNSASGYLTIINNGNLEDALQNVTSSRAGATQLINENGQAVNQLAIPDGTMTQLTPGGARFKLLQVSPPIRFGEQFPVTLLFKHSGSITVQAEVRDDNMQHRITIPMRNNEHFPQHFSGY